MATQKVQLKITLGTNPKDKSKLYYLAVDSDKQIGIDNMNYRSNSFTEYEMGYGLNLLADGIVDALLSGDSFYADKLGTFRLKVTAKSNTDKTKFSVKSVDKTDIVFTPCSELLKRVRKNVEYTLAGLLEEEEEETEETPSEDENTENKLEVE